MFKLGRIRGGKDVKESDSDQNPQSHPKRIPAYELFHRWGILFTSSISAAFRKLLLIQVIYFVIMQARKACALQGQQQVPFDEAVLLCFPNCYVSRTALEKKSYLGAFCPGLLLPLQSTSFLPWLVVALAKHKLPALACCCPCKAQAS